MNISFHVVSPFIIILLSAIPKSKKITRTGTREPKMDKTEDMTYVNLYIGIHTDTCLLLGSTG